MPPHGVTFNRVDCPYGCGAALLDSLRWTTPCPGCQRLLHPVLACWPDASDEGTDGEELWPPPHVPRPPGPSPAGARILYVVTDEESADRARVVRELMRATGNGRPPSSESQEVAGPAAVLMLMASATATLVVAVAASSVAAAATGDDRVLVVSVACGAALGIAWLVVSMTIAASRDMPMALQFGLLITCPIVPVLVAAATAAGFDVPVVILTVGVIAGFLLALRVAVSRENARTRVRTRHRKASAVDREA